jgi:hypothetical protein
VEVDAMSSHINALARGWVLPEVAAFTKRLIHDASGA